MVKLNLMRGIKFSSIRLLTYSVTLYLFVVSPVHGLSNIEKNNYRLDTRLLVRVLADYQDFPDSDLSPIDNFHVATGVMRFEFQHGWRAQFSSYINVLVSQSSDRLSGVGIGDINRSGKFYQVFNDDKNGALVLDQFDLTYESEQFRVRLGRQAIGLATTFYFSPNDFFAPFAPQTFYRVFRAGVDAVRVTWFTGTLSEVEGIYVLGYDRQSPVSSEFESHPSSQLDSILVRSTQVIGAAEVNVFVAQIHDDQVLGGAIQADWPPWLGFRLEAQVRDFDKGGRRNEIAVSVDHRFEMGLDVRGEWFYHGSGANDAQEYQVPLVQAEDSVRQLARYYMAIGSSYNLTPLWTIDGSIIFNLVDHSEISSLQALYSVSDESEFICTLSIARGEESDNLLQLKSEYGLLPNQLSFEYRIYF